MSIGTDDNNDRRQTYRATPSAHQADGGEEYRWKPANQHPDTQRVVVVRWLDCGEFDLAYYGQEDEGDPYAWRQAVSNCLYVEGHDPHVWIDYEALARFHLSSADRQRPDDFDPVAMAMRNTMLVAARDAAVEAKEKAERERDEARQGFFASHRCGACAKSEAARAAAQAEAGRLREALEDIDANADDLSSVDVRLVARAALDAGEGAK
jgi:hypothetical protein